MKSWQVPIGTLDDQPLGKLRILFPRLASQVRGSFGALVPHVAAAEVVQAAAADGTGWIEFIVCDQLLCPVECRNGLVRVQSSGSALLDGVSMSCFTNGSSCTGSSNAAHGRPSPTMDGGSDRPMCDL